MALSEDARKVWKSKGGSSLLGTMLGQHQMTDEGQAALAALKAMNGLERARAEAVLEGEALEPNADAAAGRDATAGDPPGAEG